MKFGWSGAKKSWCCAMKHIGCGGHYHYYGGPRYGGGPHYGDGPHYGGGPHYGTYHDSFDCSAGYAMRHNGWSNAKKSWCCVHKGVDCWHPHHTSQAYDCAAGYGNCWAGWSDQRSCGVLSIRVSIANHRSASTATIPTSIGPAEGSSGVSIRMAMFTATQTARKCLFGGPTRRGRIVATRRARVAMAITIT